MQEISEVLLYTGDNGDVKLKVFLENQDLWLSQKMMGELFDVESNTVNYHIREIYKSKELEEISITRKFRVVQTV